MNRENNLGHGRGWAPQAMTGEVVAAVYDLHHSFPSGDRLHFDLFAAVRKLRPLPARAQQARCP
jgi:hypothetical protein